MIISDKIVNYVKFLVYGASERYTFNNQRLSFKTGTRPIRRKYRNSSSDIVRNDVLQIEYFEKNFKEEDVFWDIGSHNGHYSIFAASVVKGCNQVFSFEPDADALRMQIQNVELNEFERKVIICEFAISNIDGELQFMADGGNANSHLVKGIDKDPRGRFVTVKTRTINSLLNDFPRPTFVKIDTEGAEIDILREATHLLDDRNVKFICELHPFAWPSFNVQFSEFEAILTAHSRKLELLDPFKKKSDLPFYGSVIF